MLDDGLDYNSLGGLGTWAAFTGFTQIAETIEGEITAESFYQAADSTSSLDLNGRSRFSTSPKSGRMDSRAITACSTATSSSANSTTGSSCP